MSDLLSDREPHSAAFLTAVAASLSLAFIAFVALGTWQIERRHWKLALIDRVERRVHAPAAAAPGPERWSAITKAADEYRHIEARGDWIGESQTLVQAVTELGAGHWVITPLRTPDGSIVLVNRGFVAGSRVAAVTAPSGTAGTAGHGSTVRGLLRMTEPGGGFLRRNDPVADHWYSRDVDAIARARELTRVAPFFIDAEAARGPAAVGADEPIAGLTVVTFHNAHLVYALTWYALGGLVGFAGCRLALEERRLRRGNGPSVTAG